MTIIRTTRLTACTWATSLAILTPLLASAAAPDTSQWKCEFCPFEDGTIAGEVETGSLYVGDDAAKFGEYDGLKKRGSYLVLDASAGQRAASGLFWQAIAQDLGLDSRSAAASAGRDGAWQIDLGYVASPHNIFDTTRTPFIVGADGTSALPAAWVRAGSTQGMTALSSSLHQYDLENGRERWSLGGRLDLAARWHTELRYTREARDGQRLLGSNFIIQSGQLPGPIDFVTDQIDWSGRYETARSTISLSYFGSFFADRLASFRWSNPFTAIAPGADQGRSALAPDNRYNQIAIGFSHQLADAWYLRMNGSLGWAKQNEDFLSYTVNPLITTMPLPRTSLDGKLDISQFDAQLSGDVGAYLKLLKGLRGKLSYRYYERDNGTSQSDYRYVEGDTFLAGTARNLPYGYRRQNISASGEYEIGHLLRPESRRAVKLSGGWEHEEWKRTFQEVMNSTEDRAWVRVRVRPLPWLELDGRYAAANRNSSPYVTSPLGSAPQNPLLRKFNLADRERVAWDFGAQLSLPRDTALSLAGFHRQDDYINSKVGLTRSRDAGGTADLSWTITEDFSTFAFYGHEEITSLQSGSQAFGQPDWRSRYFDQFDTASIGLRFNDRRNRWNLQFDYFLLDGGGDIEVSAGVPDRFFPPLRTRSHGPRLQVVFQASPALKIIGKLQYQHFDTDDWALADVAPDTLPSILSSGAAPYDYDVNVARLSFRYRFGGTGNADSAGGGDEP